VKARPAALLRHSVGSALRRRPATAAAIARALRRRGQPKAAAAVERAVDVVAVEGPGPHAILLLRCGGQDQVARQVEIEGWKSFEPPLPAVLVALVRTFCRDGRFADIGANTGYYALLAAAAEPTVRIDAYEPYPPVVDLLRRNRDLNDADRIDVWPMAVGSAPGKATLYVPLADHGLVETSSSLNATFDSTRVGERIEVAVDTLDRLYEGRPAPAVLKVDVESLEPEVLEGGAALLDRHRPLLVLELLPHEDPGRLEALRGQHRYVDVRLRPATALVGGPVVPDPDSWNHLWIPEERRAQVVELLAAIGLDVVESP
jgi:FkbM family methyltransferase